MIARRLGHGAARVFGAGHTRAHGLGRVLPIDPREQWVLDELRRRRAERREPVQ